MAWYGIHGHASADDSHSHNQKDIQGAFTIYRLL